MDAFEWKDIYSVGNTALDTQHKKLFAMVNYIIINRDKPVYSKEFYDLLDEMLDYAKQHFISEEQYMREIGFDDLENHILEHKQFEINAYQFCQDVVHNKKTLPYDILKYLVNWLLDHIMISDMKYKTF